MEGNECYKFSTIRNFIERTRAKDVRLAVDIGANVGAVTVLMHSYFPNVTIYAFEPVREYFELAVKNTGQCNGTRIFQRAVTGQHRYWDDFGKQPRQATQRLVIMKGLPEAGPGWAGGSLVVPADNDFIGREKRVPGYQQLPQPVRAMTLGRVVSALLRKERADEIDIVKMDCEGCEHSGLGCTSVADLKKIRYIVGEYHGIERFHSIMKNKLFKTHKVNLIGSRDLGAFFAERLEGKQDGILRWDKSGMLISRPWLSKAPIDWHLFNEQFVLPAERRCHALPA
jgi:FkbM family methyltransferase